MSPGVIAVTVALWVGALWAAAGVILGPGWWRPRRRRRPVPPHTDPPMSPLDQAETARAWPSLVSRLLEDHHDHDA